MNTNHGYHKRHHRTHAFCLFIGVHQVRVKVDYFVTYVILLSMLLHERPPRFHQYWSTCLLHFIFISKMICSLCKKMLIDLGFRQFCPMITYAMCIIGQGNLAKAPQTGHCHIIDARPFHFFFIPSPSYLLMYNLW